MKDADTTGVCFAVLGKAGYDLDPQLLYQYEEARYFRCYLLERNPSVSPNTHILDALHYCDQAERAERVEKVVTSCGRCSSPATSGLTNGISAPITPQAMWCWPPTTSPLTWCLGG